MILRLIFSHIVQIRRKTEPNLLLTYGYLDSFLSLKKKTHLYWLFDIDINSLKCHVIRKDDDQVIGENVTAFR